MSSSSTQNHSIQQQEDHVLGVSSKYRQRRSSTDELAALGTVADASPELTRPPTQNEINSLLASISEDSSEPESMSSIRKHDSVSTAIDKPESHSISTSESTSPKLLPVNVLNNSKNVTNPSLPSAATSYSHTSSGMTSSAVSPKHSEADPLSSTSQACPVPLDLNRSRSIRGVSVQRDEDGSNSVSVNSPPESIQAYALLDFENFTFYVQTMQILLGRMVEGDKNTEVLDIHLGPQKAISRRHAKIFYNFGHQRFEMTVLGRNGAFVDDTFIEQGVTLPLKNDTRIQIGETRFRFMLPGDDGSVSSKATTPGAVEGERSSVSNVSEMPMNPSQAADLKAAFTDEKKRSDKLMAGAIETHSFSDGSSKHDKSSLSGNKAIRASSQDVIKASSPSSISIPHGKLSSEQFENNEGQELESTSNSRSTLSQATMLGLADAHEAQAKAIAENEAFAIKKGYLPANWQQHQAMGDSAHQTQTQTQGGMAVSKISNVSLGSLSDNGGGSNSQIKKEKRRPRKRIYKPEEIPEPYRQKPGYSYCTMIIECLKQRATPRGMTLSEIYEGIREMYPYYKFCSEGWRSSVRHNLSTNQCFRKVAKDGKGWFWGLSEGAEEREKQELKKQKLKEERKRRHRQRQEELSKASALTRKGPSTSSTSSSPRSNFPETDKKTGSSAPTSKLSGDTKRALGYLQKELVRLTKDRKLYDRGTTTQILTQALAMTIAQVNQAAKNAGIKGSPLLTLIDKNPGHVTKILSAALNAATIQIARKKGLPIRLPPRNKAGSPTSKKESISKTKSASKPVKKEPLGAKSVTSPDRALKVEKASTETIVHTTAKVEVSVNASRPVPHLLTPPKIKPMKPVSSAEMHNVSEQPAGIRKPKYYSKHAGPAMFRPISRPAPFTHDKTAITKEKIQAKALPSEFMKFAHPSPPVQFMKKQVEREEDGKVDKELDLMMKSLEGPAEIGKKHDEAASGKRSFDEASDNPHKIQKK